MTIVKVRVHSVNHTTLPCTWIIAGSLELPTKMLVSISRATTHAILLPLLVGDPITFSSLIRRFCAVFRDTVRVESSKSCRLWSSTGWPSTFQSMNVAIAVQVITATLFSEMFTDRGGVSITGGGKYNSELYAQTYPQSFFKHSAKISNASKEQFHLVRREWTLTSHKV